MKKILFGIACAVLGCAITGCTSPTVLVDTENDLGPQIAGIDYRDVEKTANVMLQSLFRSGRLDRTDGNVYVMTVGRIANDTNRRDFDTDILASYITQELMQSGKVMVTSAMSATPSNRDEMVNAARTVRGNAEFNQNSVPKTGQLAAPSHSVFGKIVERQIRMDSGDIQIEYWFQLRITEIASGLQWWQNQSKIVKRTGAPNAMAR